MENFGYITKKKNLFIGDNLFGLNNPATLKILAEHHVPICKPNEQFHTRCYILFGNWINNNRNIIAQLKSLYLLGTNLVIEK